MFQRSFDELGLGPQIDGLSGAVRDPYYRDVWAYVSGRSWSGHERVSEFGAHSNGIMASLLAAVGCTDYEHLVYPQVDLLRPRTVPRAQFDVALLDEILEHVPNPFVVAETLFRALRPGGVVICSTVFLYPRHYVDPADKQDYFRFTPEGLRA